MLDINALSQLKKLKQEIHDSTPRFEGKVRGTSGRYGFAMNQEGKSYFLTPDEMEKVLPGDEISFRVEPTSDDKEQALIEKVIRSDIRDFCGRYIIKGKGHFIEPDHDSLNRWIFVPPSARMNAKDGDLVAATLTKHPYPHGKAQASITKIIGNDETTNIERLFMMARAGIEEEVSEAALAEAKTLCEQGLDNHFEDRTDLTHIPFVTIDSAGTRDIDDALFAESHGDGWTLWVAIADPAALIQPGSELDNSAQKRATSVYFPDTVLPMLPVELSEQLCSLQAETKRLALVAEIHLSEEASVKEIKLHRACIESRAKLTYMQVAQHIDSICEDIPAELHGSIHHLADCATALNLWRQKNALVMEERPDFKLVLNPEGKISEILKIERNDAHKLVEECMLVCNRSVAEWLKERGLGFFIEQKGIRTERIGEVSALLTEQLALTDKPKLDDLNTYIELIQKSEQVETELPLKTIISKQMDRSKFGQSGLPHLGLGFSCYTTFTSPLRKYNDLLIHRIIHSVLKEDETPTSTDDTLLESIQDAQSRGRLAANLSEQWLKLIWLAAQPESNSYPATLVYMNNNNFTVRLDDTGIEGSIDRRKAKGKWVFDSKTMTHKNGDHCYMLGMQFKVIVQELDIAKRDLKFRLA